MLSSREQSPGQALQYRQIASSGHNQVLPSDKVPSKKKTQLDAQVAVEEITIRLATIRRQQAFLLNPSGKLMENWDLVIIASLIFTASVTPYEIALLRIGLNPLFFINRLVDLIFTVDIFINFRLMFYDEGEVKLVKSWRAIALRYIEGRLVVDLLSVIPGYIDCFTIDYDGRRPSFKDGRLSMTLVLRLVRLTKMARLFKASSILERMLTDVNIKNSGMTLLRNTLLMAITTHWMACTWALVLQLEGTESHTWMNGLTGTADACTLGYAAPPGFTSEGYAQGLYSGARGEDVGKGLAVEGVVNWQWDECHSSSDLYVYALYWGMVNLVSGTAMWPTTQTEYIFCTLMMAVGAYIWAYIMAHVTAVAINKSFEVQSFEETMDQVNDFITGNRITDRKFTRKLRKFVVFKRYQNQDASVINLLTKLSPGIGGECAKFGATVIESSKVKWLRQIAQHHLSAMLDLMLSFDSEVYGPQENVHKVETLFIVCRGVCARDGHILIRSSSWGEDSLLLSNQANVSVRNSSDGDSSESISHSVEEEVEEEVVLVVVCSSSDISTNYLHLPYTPSDPHSSSPVLCVPSLIALSLPSYDFSPFWPSAPPVLRIPSMDRHLRAPVVPRP
jgi:hypothetical protein